MTTSSRKRPPLAADEPTQLLGWLDLQRDVVRWKCEGLVDTEAHRVVLPTSPLMTMAGLVCHLRWVEHAWFEVMFLGRSTGENPQFVPEPEDADMLADGIPLAQLLEDYERQSAVSNEIIVTHSLDDVGRHPDFDVARATLRWMLLHMIEETARHAGHADIIRELLDKETGYY